MILRNDWLIALCIDWYILENTFDDVMSGWLRKRLIDRLVNIFINNSINKLIDGFIYILFDRLIEVIIDGFIDWIID